MDIEPFSKELIIHYRNRLDDFEKERAVFMARINLMDKIINDNYEEEKNTINSQKNIMNDLMDINQLKQSLLEERRKADELGGENIQMKGIINIFSLNFSSKNYGQ
jgi:predicted RNase H-like nuclease (RuvC/YqgF family)